MFQKIETWCPHEAEVSLARLPGLLGNVQLKIKSKTTKTFAPLRPSVAQGKAEPGSTLPAARRPRRLPHARGPAPASARGAPASGRPRRGARLQGGVSRPQRPARPRAHLLPSAATAGCAGCPPRGLWPAVLRTSLHRRRPSPGLRFLNFLQPPPLPASAVGSRRPRPPPSRGLADPRPPRPSSGRGTSIPRCSFGQAPRAECEGWERGAARRPSIPAPPSPQPPQPPLPRRPAGGGLVTAAASAAPQISRCLPAAAPPYCVTVF